MKKHIAFLLTLIWMLSGCGAVSQEQVANQDQISAEASGLQLHKIGVATYNVQDAQVQMFKEYLDGYIKECFPDVTFLYSDSIGSEEEMMTFLQNCADSGAEGMMFFYTNDLQKEVEFCARNHMYCIRPSGNVSDAEFQKVADNGYFLGEIGPGSAAEYAEAVKMTHFMAQEGNGYIILSGGAFMGNEMHRLRTIGMLDALQEIYATSFQQSAETLALSAEPTVAEAEGLKVIICPGYVELPVFGEPASAAIRSGAYTTVLSAIPVTPLMDALNDSTVKCGVIDCFSEDNYFGFQKGKIGYVAGKYQSEIGPAFAALYNAINGDSFRENGKAFRLVQGYWTATSAETYSEMYALARGTAINAYNYEDLYAVVTRMNPDADFAAFRTLTESCSYEDCLARRSQ